MDPFIKTKNLLTADAYWRMVDAAHPFFRISVLTLFSGRKIPGLDCCNVTLAGEYMVRVERIMRRGGSELKDLKGLKEELF